MYALIKILYKFKKIFCRSSSSHQFDRKHTFFLLMFMSVHLWINECYLPICFFKNFQRIPLSLYHLYCSLTYDLKRFTWNEMLKLRLLYIYKLYICSVKCSFFSLGIFIFCLLFGLTYSTTIVLVR